MLPRNRLWAAALFAAWLAPVSAWAQVGAFASSPAGGRLRAGEVVPVSWRLDPGDTGGRDEMELVLSLDDGATFPIRVVTLLAAADGNVSWRIPALSTERARLALRAGDDGGADTEEIVAVSEPFAIATARFEALERLYAVAGEWRTRDALEGAPAADAEGGLGPQGPLPEMASGGPDKGETETSPAVELRPTIAAHGLDAKPAPSSHHEDLLLPAPRASLPLRL